jgi:hypothetical protein
MPLDGDEDGKEKWGSPSKKKKKKKRNGHF